jgi:hypothetical protein
VPQGGSEQLAYGLARGPVPYTVFQQSERRPSLSLKTSIPNLFRLSFNPDSLGALLGLWILTEQQDQYFPSEKGQNFIPQDDPRIQHASGFLLQRIERWATRSLPDQITRVLESVEAHVEAIPCMTQEDIQRIGSLEHERRWH